jgi:uncharacterized Tic20 family protein
MSAQPPQEPFDNADPPAATDSPDQAARTWGMLCHLSALTGLITLIGFILGPLVVWLLKKDELPFVDDQGKEALNFQITMALLFCVCWALMFVLIGLLLMPILALVNIVLVIIASLKANNGERYRYPFALRLIT